MSTCRKSQLPSPLDYVDELDAQISSLLDEVRFIATLSACVPPQFLDIDSRGLTALLTRIVDGLQVAQELTQKMWQSK